MEHETSITFKNFVSKNINKIKQCSKNIEFSPLQFICYLQKYFLNVFQQESEPLISTTKHFRLRYFPLRISQLYLYFKIKISRLFEKN